MQALRRMYAQAGARNARERVPGWVRKGHGGYLAAAPFEVEVSDFFPIFETPKVEAVGKWSRGNRLHLRRTPAIVTKWDGRT